LRTLLNITWLLTKIEKKPFVVDVYGFAKVFLVLVPKRSFKTHLKNNSNQSLEAQNLLIIIDFDYLIKKLFNLYNIGPNINRIKSSLTQISHSFIDSLHRLSFSISHSE